MAQQMKHGPQVERLHAVAGSLAGRLVAIGGEREGLASSRVHVLQLPSGEALLSAAVDAPVCALCFLADDLLIAGSARGALHAWDAGAEKPASEPVHSLAEAHAGAIRALASDPTGRLLASAGDDGTVRVFTLEVQGGRPRLAARGARRLSSRPLRAVAIESGSQVVVAAGDDGVIRSLPIAELDTTGAPREMPCGEGGIFALALSGDGRVAAGCGDGSVRLCYLEGATDEENRSGEAAHGAPVRGLVFGPLLRDEHGRELQRRLLSVGEDGMLKAWLLEQRRKPRTLELGPSPLHALAWLPAPGHAKPEARGGTLAAVNKARDLLLVTLSQESEPADGVRRIRSELARLEEELGAKSVEVRKAAVDALAQLPEDDARVLLDRALQGDRDATVRKLAAEAMGRSGRRLSRPALRKALDDDHQPVREAALAALEALERDRPLQPIRAALGSKHADLRLAAVRRLPALRASSPLVPGLIAGALSDVAPEVRAGAFAALLELEPPGSLGPLRTALERGPADVRAMAVARLTRPEHSGQEAARQLLEASLDDGEAMVRGIAFVSALATRPRLSARVRVLDPATAKALDDYKAQGLCELTSSGDPTEADLQPLFAAMGCRHADTALRGARILALLGDSRAAGALLQLSREEDAETRRYVVEALYVGAWTLKDDRLRARLEWLLDDPDAQVRSWALGTLEKLAEPEGDEGALRLAETALRCASEDMRARALQILVQFGGDGARGKGEPALRTRADELLGQALDDEHADARGEAFRTLWAWHAREPRLPCVRGAASRHADIRVKVVAELTRIAEAWADELLCKLTEDAAAEVGLAAYAALTDEEKHKTRAATQARRAEVHLGAMRSPRPEVRAAGCRGAARHAALAKALRARLCELVREDNPVVHIAAIEAADRLIPDDQEVFAAAFASIFYNLRVRAGELCGKRRDVRAVEPMKLLLTIPKTDLNRPADEYRQRAARALADVGDPGTIPFYVKLLDDEDPIVREMGARGLATACRPGEEQPLVDALAHADLPVRSWAAEGLARLGDERALPVLAGTLKHEHPPIRKGAILSFVALGPDGVRGILQGLADPDRDVQDLVFATIVARDIALARAGLAPDLLLLALSSSHPEIRYAAARVLEARTSGDALFEAAQELCGPRRPEKAAEMKDWPAERDRPALLNVLVRALASDHPAQRYAAAQVLALKAQPLGFWREAKRLAAPSAAERPWIPHTSWEDAKREPRKKGWLRRLFGKAGGQPVAAGGSATERILTVLKFVGAPTPQPLPASGEAIAESEIRRLAFGTYAGLVRQAPASGEADETHRVRRDSLERLAELASLPEVGREAVLPVFRRALSDPHHLVRKAALAGLRKLYGAGSLEPLALALASSAADVGRQAVDELCAAAAAGSAEAAELARGALTISPNSEVRAHALGRLPRLYAEGSVEPWLLALACPHPDVRLSVVDRLVDLRDERVTRALGQAMESSHEDLRLKAADALARRGDARTVEVLGAFLRSEDAAVSRRAVEALCALAHARPGEEAQPEVAAAAAEVVARRLEDDPDKTADRGALISALARIASPAADPVLIRLLADEDGSVRRQAFSALLAIAKDPRTPARLYPDGTRRERYDETLALRYLGEGAACSDAAVRELAAQHLADVDDNRAEVLLAKLTMDREESVRVAACQRLAFRAERLETATTEPLSAALRAGRRELVLPAAAGLAARRRPEAFQALLLVLKAGEGAEREQAVLGLGALGDRRALEELEPLVDPRAEVPEEDKLLAPAAAMALGMMITRLEDEEERRRVRETVERLVREGTPAVRPRAIAGLRLAGDDRSRGLIERIASDRHEDATIRLAAVNELGLLGKAESEPALAQVLDDDNYQLRRAALEALGRAFPEDRTRVALLALRSRFADVSQPAASFLALHGEAGTLVERLPEIENPEVRRRLRRGLVRRGTRPIESLRRLLEGGRPEARAEAAWVAGATGDATLGGPVLAAVERSASGWREARKKLAGVVRAGDDRELAANVEAWRASLWAAARIGAPAVDQARNALAEKEAPPAVHRQALRFLAAHGRGAGRAEIEGCLASPDRGVRVAAAAAIAALSPEARVVLRAVRELPAVDAAAISPMVQAVLASAGQELLGSDAGRRVALPLMIGEKRTAELCAIALASGADPARLTAIDALGRIGGDEASGALGAILERGEAEEEPVRRAAFRALRRLKRAAARTFAEGKDKEKRGSGGWGDDGGADDGDEDGGDGDEDGHDDGDDDEGYDEEEGEGEDDGDGDDEGDDEDDGDDDDEG